MSASQSATESSGRLDSLEWWSHTADMWFDRSAVPWRDPRGAFDEATEVHYPSAAPENVAYYHPEGDVIFLVYDGRVRTCIALTDRPESEQRYVRSQVIEQ